MTGLFFHNIARRWPVNPVYDPNGYYMEGNEIIQMEDGGIQRNQKDYSYQQLQLVIEPIKDWKIYAEGNLNTITNFQHWEVLPVYAHDVNGDQFAFSWDGRAVGSTTVNEYGYKENFMTTNIYSDYFKQFDNGHFIKVMGGFNAEVMKTRSLSAQGDGLITPSVPTVNTTTTNPSVGGGYAHWSTAGFFGRLNYNYKERYLVEANVRYDGTSRFVGDERWGVFPSFSLGWNIAREDFFADYTDKVSTLKLRGSWGQLGNMNTKLWYPFYQSMSVGPNNGYWLVDGEKTNTAYAPGIVSSLMTWETIESWNLGLDWGAFNNRLTGTFDYFKRSTKDMVGPAPELSSVLGTEVPKINNSDMESYGFELEVSWRDRIGDLSYGVKAVVSDAQQKVTRYPNKSNSLSTWYSGRMNGDIWGYTTLGIAKTQEEMDAHLAKVNQSRLGNQWGAGDIMYADLNGDGEISNGANTLADHGDLKIIGNNTPRYNYGITLDAAYKGFDFSVFFQGIGKRDYWVSGAYFWGATGGMWQSAGFTEHWDFFRGEDNPLGANLNAYYPRPLFTSGKNMQTQSRYLQDASYLRMKNIQLGYTLPKSITSKAGMQSVRVYVSGDNLATISSMSKIFDPETIGGAWGDGKLYPLSKTISVGLNVNF
jgi:TonB-linked SusC/RagA family outer membrane protein